MSPTQAGRFLALGETIVRTHFNLLPSNNTLNKSPFVLPTLLGMYLFA
jgi:hypothetical protein